MKMVTLLVFTLAFSCIFTKESKTLKKSNMKAESGQIQVVDRMPDTIAHAYTYNDPYILQHAAVRIIFNEAI